MALYKRIFLADDDSDDRDLFLEALNEIDDSIHCMHATDGEAAFDILSSDIFEKPELIFLDLNMPKINGKQLLKQLKSSPDLSEIPVIMYSTFFSPTDISEIKQLGATYYLLKHTSFRDLCKALSDILNNGGQRATASVH